MVANNSQRNIYFGNGSTQLMNSGNKMEANVGPLVSLGYQIPKTNFLLEPLFKYYLRDQIIANSNQYNYGLKITYNMGL